MNKNTQIDPALMRRIVVESAIVARDYPDRFRLILTLENLPAWSGDAPVEGQNAPIAVVYPLTYPADPPVVRIGVNIPRNCPHILERKNDYAVICWIGGRFVDPRRRWKPHVHTAATAIRAAQRWLLAFLAWREIGDWPVPDAFEIMTID